MKQQTQKENNTQLKPKSEQWYNNKNTKNKTNK